MEDMMKKRKAVLGIIGGLSLASTALAYDLTPVTHAGSSCVEHQGNLSSTLFHSFAAALNDKTTATTLYCPLVVGRIPNSITSNFSHDASIFVLDTHTTENASCEIRWYSATNINSFGFQNKSTSGFSSTAQRLDYTVDFSGPGRFEYFRCIIPGKQNSQMSGVTGYLGNWAYIE
jgi:hypothetical protein